MITGRRIRERAAREAAGLPPPRPRPPAEISRLEHQQILDNERSRHAKEVGELKARIAKLEAELAKPNELSEPEPEPEPEGSLSPPPDRDQLIAALADGHTKAELEGMVKELGLNATGTKAELAAAIVDHRADG